MGRKVVQGVNTWNQNQIITPRRRHWITSSGRTAWCLWPKWSNINFWCCKIRCELESWAEGATLASLEARDHRLCSLESEGRSEGKLENIHELHRRSNSSMSQEHHYDLAYLSRYEGYSLLYCSWASLIKSAVSLDGLLRRSSIDASAARILSIFLSYNCNGELMG